MNLIIIKKYSIKNFACHVVKLSQKIVGIFNSYKIDIIKPNKIQSSTGFKRML